MENLLLIYYLKKFWMKNKYYLLYNSLRKIKAIRNHTKVSLVSIQEYEIMTLSRRDQEVFVEALLNPPAPSAKLRAAAQSYKQKMGA